MIRSNFGTLKLSGCDMRFVVQIFRHSYSSLVFQITLQLKSYNVTVLNNKI